MEEMTNVELIVMYSLLSVAIFNLFGGAVTVYTHKYTKQKEEKRKIFTVLK